MRPSKKLFGDAGFTLIELLVVLMVIGILIGLLVPAIRGVGQKTLSANCQSNVRQLLIAIHLYEQETGALPNITGAGNTSGDLINRLKSRVDNFKVFHCPAHRGRAGEEYTDATTGQKTCYKYNDNGFFHNLPLDNPAVNITTLVLLIDTMDWEPRHFGGANLGFADGHVEWMLKAKYDGADPMNGSNLYWYNWGRK